MARTSSFSPEVREGAVRMVLHHAEQHESQWAAIRSIAEKIGLRGRDSSQLGATGRAGPGKRPDLTSHTAPKPTRLGVRSHIAHLMSALPFRLKASVCSSAILEQDESV